MGPAKLPPDVVATLSRALTEALAAPELRTSLAELGLVIQPSPPAETLAFVRSDLARWIAMSQSLDSHPTSAKEAAK
jgi:tripartite-type tricarboxylate transporter receptor subunit TctC